MTRCAIAARPCFSYAKACVTPHATGIDLALSGKKTEDHSTLDPMVFRQVLQCEIQQEETSYFFLKEYKRHWGRVQDNTTHLNSYMKSSLSCSY